MSVYNVEREGNESILKGTALIMLEAEEDDENFECVEAWAYISTYLCGETIGNPVVISWEVKHKCWPD